MRVEGTILVAKKKYPIPMLNWFLYLERLYPANIATTIEINVDKLVRIIELVNHLTTGRVVNTFRHAFNVYSPGIILGG